MKTLDVLSIERLGLRAAPAAFALFALLLAPLSAVAADGEDDWTGTAATRPAEESAWRTQARTGFEYQGETKLDRRGDFSYWMVSGGADLSRKLSDDVGVTIKTQYRAVGYDFSGTFVGANSTDPWNTVHVIRVMPTFAFALNESWSILVAPIGEFSGEGGAQFGDALRGGGALAGAWKGESLTVAAGVLALTEIEKDARIQPFILFNWLITDGLTLGLKADTSRGGEFRIQYAFDRMTVAAGIGVRRELFRLNGDRGGLPGTGIRRDGVGEEEATVAKITVGYRVTDTVTLEGYGGVTADGQFRLEDKNGNGLASSDYDDAGFGGVNVRFNF